MRILIAPEIFLPKRDGVTLDLEKLIRHLKSHGHEILVLGPIYSVPSVDGFPVKRLLSFPIGLYPGLHFSMVTPDIMLAISNFSPDLIYVVDPYILGGQVLAFAHLFHPNAPIVASHSTNVPYYTAVFGYGHISGPQWAYLRHAHAICELTAFRSRSSATELALRGGFDTTRMRFWKGGVDARLFTPERRNLKLRQQWCRHPATGAPRPEKRVLLYVGRVSWEKNIGVLLDLYAAMDRSRAQLVIVGDGPATDEFCSLMRGLDDVNFTGWLEGEKLAEAYASADAFVCPSVSETFGNVVAEAMASGLPVVAFDSEGIRDSVVDMATGFLVPSGSVSQLIEAANKLVQSPELASAMGTAGRERVKDWTPQQSLQSCEDIFLEATKHPDCDRRPAQSLLFRVRAVLPLLLGFWHILFLGLFSGIFRLLVFGQIRENGAARYKKHGSKLL